MSSQHRVRLVPAANGLTHEEDAAVCGMRDKLVGAFDIAQRRDKGLGVLSAPLASMACPHGLDELG